MWASAKKRVVDYTNLAQTSAFATTQPIAHPTCINVYSSLTFIVLEYFYKRCDRIKNRTLLLSSDIESKSSTSTIRIRLGGKEKPFVSHLLRWSSASNLQTNHNIYTHIIANIELRSDNFECIDWSLCCSSQILLRKCKPWRPHF